MIGVGIRINSRQRGFNPASLFANSEPGLLATFSPSDVGTRFFTDTAGSTPAEIAQAVALTLEDSGNDNHPTQATLEYRPILTRWPKTGRVNYIDENSDALTTQTVTVRAVQYTLSFKGTGTVTLSGASTAGPLVGTGAEDIVSLTFTPTAGSLTLTVDGTVQLAMLNTGATRATYQRVVTKFDITEAGQRSCIGLWYDGVDDFMNTPNITETRAGFQAFAGLAVLSLGGPTALVRTFGLSNGSGERSYIGIRASGEGGASRISNELRINSGTLFDPSIGNAFTVGSPFVATGIHRDTTISVSKNAGELSTSADADVGSAEGALSPVRIGATGFPNIFFGGFWRQGPNLSEADIKRVERAIAYNTPEVTI